LAREEALGQLQQERAALEGARRPSRSGRTRSHGSTES
jgi:hypothetical protein